MNLTYAHKTKSEKRARLIRTAVSLRTDMGSGDEHRDNRGGRKDTGSARTTTTSKTKTEIRSRPLWSNAIGIFRRCGTLGQGGSRKNAFMRVCRNTLGNRDMLARGKGAPLDAFA